MRKYLKIYQSPTTPLTNSQITSLQGTLLNMTMWTLEWGVGVLTENKDDRVLPVLSDRSQTSFKLLHLDIRAVNWTLWLRRKNSHQEYKSCVTCSVFCPKMQTPLWSFLHCSFPPPHTHTHTHTDTHDHLPTMLSLPPPPALSHTFPTAVNCWLCECHLKDTMLLFHYQPALRVHAEKDSPVYISLNPVGSSFSML